MTDRTLPDCLMEDAEDHEAAGRVIEAANARAAAAELRQVPPWSEAGVADQMAVQEPPDATPRWVAVPNSVWCEVAPDLWMFQDEGRTIRIGLRMAGGPPPNTEEAES